MPLPDSRIKALRLGLADYLKTACQSIDASFTAQSSWQYYFDTHAPTDPPQGAIWITSHTPTQQSLIDTMPIDRRVRLRFLVSDPNYVNAIALTDDWCEALFTAPDSVMRQLWAIGHSGTYEGIAITNAFKGIEMVNDVQTKIEVNQGEGGRGEIVVDYVFSDRPQHPWS